MYRMVFTQVFCWLTLLVGCCWIFGCASYRTIHVEVLKPAQVPLLDSGKIFFLYRPFIHRLVDDSTINASKVFSCEGVDKAFSNGMNYGLSLAEPVDTVIVIRKTTRSLCKTERPAPLEVDLVNQLCDRFEIKYLLSLEGHFYLPTKNHNYNWVLRLYNNEGQIVDSLFIKDRLKRRPSSDYLQSEILQKSWDHGKEYAERIKPHWSDTERRIYRDDDILKLGYLYFKQGQLDEAMDIWMKARRLAPDKSVKAAINLAWLYENGGDMEGALQLLEEAMELARQSRINPKDFAFLKEYMETIEQRIVDIETLDNQLKRKNNE